MGRNKKEVNIISNDVEIKNIKVKQFLSGSYGIYHRDKTYKVPEDINIELANQFINDGIAVNLTETEDI